jgi:hypothetical protein
MSGGTPAGGHRPDFFIVGAPKCGTTSLHRWLIGHPQVFMPALPKEPQFFARDRLARVGMRYPEELARYMSLFESEAARLAPRAGEASTAYLESPDAPSRVHDFNPGARIIAMLRNPVDMAASLHSMRVFQGLERITDLRSALDDERARPGFGQVGDQSAVHYRDRARFSVMLPRWFERFGRERVHVIVLNDLAAAPDEELERVERFLDIDPTYRPASFRRYNEREWPRSLLLARLHLALRQPWTATNVPARLRRGSYHVVGRLNRQRIARPKMPPSLRLQLQEEFAPEVEALSGLLGRDLAQLWWATSS